MTPFNPFRPISRAWAVFAAALALTAPAAVRAQSLALAPAEIDRTFQPGQPFSFQLAVANDGDQPVALRVAVTDLWYNEKGEKTFGIPGTSPRSAANWIEAVPSTVTVAANSSQPLKVMVTPPADASGGYYAVVFVESRPELVQSPTAGAKGIYANFRLGALVELTAEHTEDYSVALSDVVVSPPAENRNLSVEFKLRNLGNTHVLPRPVLAIVEDRRLVAKAEGEIQRFLPGQESKVVINWPGTLPPGRYEGVLTLIYGRDKVLTRSVPIDVPQLLARGAD